MLFLTYLCMSFASLQLQQCAKEHFVLAHPTLHVWKEVCSPACRYSSLGMRTWHTGLPLPCTNNTARAVIRSAYPANHAVAAALHR